MTTIFERYGGFGKISDVVSGFYDKVLESSALAPYFHGIDMSRLMLHQTKFLAQVMGGPTAISERELQLAHNGLHITETAFDEMLALLRMTLEECEIGADDVTFVCGQVAARKHAVVAAA
jgi:hemoglobin